MILRINELNFHVLHILNMHNPTIRLNFTAFQEGMGATERQPLRRRRIFCGEGVLLDRSRRRGICITEGCGYTLQVLFPENGMADFTG